MPNKKLTPAPPEKHSLRPLIIIAAMIFVYVGSLAAWTLYQGHEVSADKSRFAQAERDLNDLSKQIVSSAGQPAKSQTEKYCSRPNLKSGDGPLSCHIDNVNWYGVDTPEDASTIFTKASSLANQKWKFTNNAYSSNSGDTNEFNTFGQSESTPINSYQQKNKKYDTKEGMTCTLVTIFYKSSYPPSQDDEATSYPYTIEVSFICSDYAKIEHYPMKS